MTTAAGAPVVVGVDGSPQSLAAVETAAAEAMMRHRDLRIVHAFSWPPVGTVYAPQMAGPSLQALRELAQTYLTEAAQLADKLAPDVHTTTGIAAGWAAPALLDESRRAALVVLGDRGRGGLADLTIGSTAVQVAAHAAAPVLVVRGDHRPDGPVVVGVDGSATSLDAVEFAAQEAELRGADLVALHAWSDGDITQLDGTLPISYETWPAEQQEQEQRVLAEALAGLAERHPDLHIRREVRRGSARRLLADRSHTARMLVVGDRGHGGFTGLLLGSVSQYLLHNAACPTAVVRRNTARN